MSHRAGSTQSFEELSAGLTDRGIDVAKVMRRLVDQRIEVPSWAFGDAGTRFGVYHQAGAPRDAFEKLSDAAELNSLVPISPRVAIHIPWDRVEDPAALRQHADSLGLEIGAVNPNLFSDQRYRIGSICNPDPGVRAAAHERLLECVELAVAYGSDAISLWLADGTNYPGQDSFRARRERLMSGLGALYEAMPETMTLLLEYKFYEPAFYATDLADWGSSLLACEELGERAQVLVDLGHHAQGVNIEQIVSMLLARGRLGGFHLNNRKYGDDDLIVGSVNPLELMLIYLELTGEDALEVRYMLDQSHNVEQRIEAMIVSLTNCQEAWAKALLVDRPALAEAQSGGDVNAANQIVMNAYATDVRPLCARAREELGGEADPVRAFRESGYAATVADERAEAGTATGLGS